MGKTLPASLIRLNLKAGAERFGAPLVSGGGAVCGIVLLGMEDGKMNVSYALPVELILKVRRDFVKHGKVEESWIGFGMEQGTTTPEVRTIQKGAPAEGAGLAVGDIIHTIGDRKVRDYQDVVDACYYLTPGDEVVFKVLRGLDDMDLRVTPAPKRKAAAPASAE
jgi:serine protease DegQ